MQDVKTRGLVWLAALGVIWGGSCGGNHRGAEAPGGEAERGPDVIEDAAEAARLVSGDFCAEYNGYIEYIDETGPVSAEESLEWYRRFDTPAEVSGDVRTTIEILESLAGHATPEAETSQEEDELAQMREAHQRISSYVESDC